ncbi:MAG: type II secretion system F family protein [Candidatus Falkowbacteria bacterium]
MNIFKKIGHSLSTVGLGKSRDSFMENLGILVGAGMSIFDAIDAVSGDIDSRHMQRVIVQIKDDVEAGSPLWRALESSGLFPDHSISLARIGEESGRLSENLQIISAEQQKNRIFKSRIRSAVAYPIFVLGLTGFIGVGISWFVLPKLANVFTQLHLQLPLLTRLLITFSNFLGSHGVIAVPTIILTITALAYFIFFFPGSKRIGQGILFLVPGVGRLMREVELSRFGYLLGILLAAGLPITQSVNSLIQSCDTYRYKKFYKFLGKNLEDGNSFQQSFDAYHGSRHLIPSSIQKLIIAGERSGTLADALMKVGSNYEAKTETTVRDLTVILEPLLLIIVWFAVIGVALAIIMPIYNLLGGMGSQQ